jgi:hypothetical protein
MRVREFLGPSCDAQLRVVSRLWRDQLASTPLEELRISDYMVVYRMRGVLVEGEDPTESDAIRGMGMGLWLELPETIQNLRQRLR